jgi:hypothetical protein
MGIPVLAGFAVGTSGSQSICSMVIGLSLLCALILAVSDFVAALSNERPRTQIIGVLALIGYVGFLLHVELNSGFTPLQSRSDSVTGLLAAVAWFSPLVIGAGVARSLKHSPWTWWSILFAAAVVLCYNAVNRHSSLGFLYVAFE